ncbi:hypothetical protein [Dulcicalothrix desertica]|uniref:hypothetical protein n=1 Tax=Dulcicalothrix desertica TaxID=32056 RepID=UPI0013154C07|nr:hypothetical protein [Dulcicalothrix desertica]
MFAASQGAVITDKIITRHQLVLIIFINPHILLKKIDRLTAGKKEKRKRIKGNRAKV